MEKTYNIKNKQTGYIFNMSKADCDRLVLEEPYNFEVVDKDYVSPIKEEPKETPTFKKVVVEDKPKVLEDYSVPELKEYLTKNTIEIKSNAKKAELLTIFQQQNRNGQQQQVISNVLKILLQFTNIWGLLPFFMRTALNY